MVQNGACSERTALMPVRFGIVERAFQLARSGEQRTIPDIAQRLIREGYVDVDEHFWQCRSLAKQLRSLSAKASKNGGAAEHRENETCPTLNIDR